VRIAAVCLLALLLLPVAVSAGDAFEIQKVADGVYIAMRRPTAPMAVGSNAAIIINDDHVVVVDTHYTPSAARALLAEIKQLTHKPVRYVVNSHWHNDHVQGNQAYFNVFPGGVEFISSHATREDIEKKAIPSVKQELENLPQQIAQAEEQLARGVGPDGQPVTAEQAQNRRAQLEVRRAYLGELRELQISLPTITFERSLVLHREPRPIHVLFFGRGHTRGDVVVYLPKEKVLITGDLVTTANGWPFPRDSYPAAWARTLRSIAELDFTRLIPGHGAVHEDKAHVERLAALFAAVGEHVAAAVKQGLTLEQTQQKVNVDALRDAIVRGDAQGLRAFAVDIKTIIARAYLEAKGEE